MYGSLGGVTLKILEASRAPERVGGLSRTVNGALRGDPLWEAVAFDLEVVAETDPEADAIYAAADGRTTQTFTGTLPDGVRPGGLPVKAEVKRDTYRRVWFNGAYGHYRVLSLSVREAL